MSILFKKTFLLMVGMFSLIAIVTSISLGRELHKALTEEYRSKGIAISKGIATSAVQLILTRDASTVQATIDQYLDIRGVLYVFVVNDEQEVISHTFVPAVPTELSGFQQHNDDEHTLVRTMEIKGVGTVMDVSEPILSGLIGYVHVGMDVKLIEKAFWHAMIQQQGVILAIFVFCVLLAYLLVGKISSPLVHLTEMARSLAHHDFSSGSNFDGEKNLQKISSRDEIGDLADAFRTLITELHRSIEVLKETTAVKERIESELNIARNIQMDFLPQIFPAFPDHHEFDVYATVIPAKEVGGDLYDFFLLDDEHLCVTIGDVSGKGVPAALFMAVTITLIKSISALEFSPGVILSKVNEELYAGNESCMFVSTFLGILNLQSGIFLYSNGGHNPPFLLKKTGDHKRLAMTDGPVLGVVDGITYSEHKEKVEAGDVLVFYTDGVTEAMDPKYNEFTEQRLVDVLKQLDRDNSRGQVEAILESVHEFALGAEQSDDITVMTVLLRESEK